MNYKIKNRKDLSMRILNRNRFNKNSSILHVSLLESGKVFFGFHGHGTYYDCECDELFYFLQNQKKIKNEREYKIIEEYMKETNMGFSI